MERPLSSTVPLSGFRSDGQPVLRVSELAAGLRSLVEDVFEDVRVEGELSNFKRHTSGHCYFTLKDADAQLRGVMWRTFAQNVFFQPRDGMLVRVQGQVSVYEQRGDLQPGGVVVEGTAGNTGIGLALVGNARGYRTACVTDNPFLGFAVKQVQPAAAAATALAPRRWRRRL